MVLVSGGDNRDQSVLCDAKPNTIPQWLVLSQDRDREATIWFEIHLGHILWWMRLFQQVAVRITTYNVMPSIHSAVVTYMHKQEVVWSRWMIYPVYCKRSIDLKHRWLRERPLHSYGLIPFLFRHVLTQSQKHDISNAFITGVIKSSKSSDRCQQRLTKKQILRSWRCGKGTEVLVSRTLEYNLT